VSSLVLVLLLLPLPLPLVRLLPVLCHGFSAIELGIQG
jgi:hypothetical protein